MTVIVDICNMALDHLGKANITDIDEGSNEAQRCKRQYPHSRKLALSYSPWTFATKTEQLAKNATNTQSDVWTFSYDAPNDALQSHMRLLHAGEPARTNTPPPAMHLEAGSIFTHVEDARLFYTYDNTDLNAWPIQFMDAVAYMLAYRLAPSMTRRKSDTQDLYAAYMDAVSKAVEFDAGQVPSSYVWSGGYTDARDAGSTEYGAQQDGSSIWE